MNEMKHDDDWLSSVKRIMQRANVGQHIAKASASAQTDKNNQIKIRQISKDSKQQF